MNVIITHTRAYIIKIYNTVLMNEIICKRQIFGLDMPGNILFRHQTYLCNLKVMLINPYNLYYKMFKAILPI